MDLMIKNETPLIIGKNIDNIVDIYRRNSDKDPYNQIGLGIPDIGWFINLEMIHKEREREMKKIISNDNNLSTFSGVEWIIHFIDLFITHELCHYLEDIKHSYFCNGCSDKRKFNGIELAIICTTCDCEYFAVKDMEAFIWQEFLELKRNNKSH